MGLPRRGFGRVGPRPHASRFWHVASRAGYAIGPRSFWQGTARIKSTRGVRDDEGLASSGASSDEILHHMGGSLGESGWRWAHRQTRLADIEPQMIHHHLGR